MYTKLANSILTSTVWMESNETRIVWLTLLAMCDKNGEVQASIPGLANVARVTVKEAEEAIEVFLAPDPYSSTKTDEGRRIEEIEGGWVLLNHGKYRDFASDSDVKRKAAERQRRYRERQKRNAQNVTPSVTGVTLCEKSHPISHTDTDTKAKNYIYTPGPDVTIPEHLQTPQMITAVGSWLQHLEWLDTAFGTHKAIQPNSPQEQALWATLLSWGCEPAEIVASINAAIAGQWQNLRKPEPPRQQNGNRKSANGGIAEIERIARELDERERLQAEAKAARRDLTKVHDR